MAPPSLAVSVCLYVTLFAVAAPSASGVSVTPISKVLQLLQDMLVKGKAEKDDEAVKFAAFSEWCSGSSRVKTNEINAAGERKEMLDAKIGEGKARSRALSERVAELEEDVARWKKDQMSITSVRDREAADYKATANDYAESLEAIDSAIAVLKKQAFSRPQAEAALVQLRGLRLMPSAATKALAAFLQQAQAPDEQLFLSPPEAHGYEFQSGGVIDMLEKLKDQFATKKYELDQEELNAKHAFGQMLQQLTDSIDNAEHEASKKALAKTSTDQTVSSNEGDLSLTISDKAEDEKYLAEMTQLCQSKKTDFESRQKLRGEEIGALEKAIDAISGAAVAGAGEKHLPSAMLQFPSAKQFPSLVQLRSRGGGNGNGVRGSLQTQIAEFLSDRARTCNSKLLTLISQRVATDPFDKVKKMIKDLIVKLMEEGTAETERKGWCDTELATNKLTRDAKSEEVSKLTAEVESLNAEITQLAQDASDITSEMKELDAAMAAAVAERIASKQKNSQTVAEAKEAQVILEKAVAVVKEYYAQSAEATALLQKQQHLLSKSNAARRQSPLDDAPETFDKPYQGQIPEGGNVVDFLEVILSDFARLEAETATSEASAQSQHETFMFESKKDKALKETALTHKGASKTSKESDLHSTQEELKSTQEQLDKAMEYHEKLKPSCVDSGVTYEDRVKQRDEEIQSLQEALKILTGTDINLGL